MGHGENKLATQVGAKGYFGKVTVEAKTVDGDGEVTVDFAEAIPEQWKSGASFGIQYVLEHVTKRKLFPKGGIVRVLFIEGHEVDTNNVVIAFVAAHALYNALGVQPTKQPEFDASKGTFTFPK
jgi:hypothetical protein